MSGLLLFPFYIYSFISYNSEIQDCCIQNFSYKDVFNEKIEDEKKKVKEKWRELRSLESKQSSLRVESGFSSFKFQTRFCCWKSVLIRWILLIRTTNTSIVLCVYNQIIFKSGTEIVEKSVQYIFTRSSLWASFFTLKKSSNFLAYRKLYYLCSIIIHRNNKKYL